MRTYSFTAQPETVLTDMDDHIAGEVHRLMPTETFADLGLVYEALALHLRDTYFPDGHYSLDLGVDPNEELDAITGAPHRKVSPETPYLRVHHASPPHVPGEDPERVVVTVFSIDVRTRPL